MKDNLTALVRAPGFLFAVGIGPVFLYPCLYLVLFMADTLFGDRVILDHLFNASKRYIWDLFWRDWASALLSSYVIVSPILVAAFAIRHFSRRSLWIVLPSCTLIASLLISFALFAGGHMIVLFAAALVFSLPATWILSKCGS